MEKYLVVGQVIANTKKYQNQRIIKLDSQLDVKDQVPADYEQLYGPAGLDACVAFLKESTSSRQNWFALTVFQYVLIAIVTLAFVWVVYAGAEKLWSIDPATHPLKLLKTADDAARIMITFLVAVVTVAVAFLAILTAMVLREFKERFVLAKEVLTLLVGILGTIVGFYFGTAGKAEGNAGTQGTSGTPTPTPTPTPTQTPRPTVTPVGSPNAYLLRGTHGKEIARAYQHDDKWRIYVF